VAKNLSEKNKYIVSATLNGKPFNKSWIEYQDIVDGGSLVLEMGESPSTTWGTAILPPSKSDK